MFYIILNSVLLFFLPVAICLCKYCEIAAHVYALLVVIFNEHLVSSQVSMPFWYLYSKKTLFHPKSVVLALEKETLKSFLNH